jgi:hypothetical protein
VQQAFRLFNCRRCGLAVRVCGPCERGQVYCRGGCAAISRRQRVREAGRATWAAAAALSITRRDNAVTADILSNTGEASGRS